MGPGVVCACDFVLADSGMKVEFEPIGRYSETRGVVLVFRELSTMSLGLPLSVKQVAFSEMLFGFL